MESNVSVLIITILALASVVICCYFTYTTTKNDYKKGEKNTTTGLSFIPLSFVALLLDGEFSNNDVFATIYLFLLFISVSISFLIAKFENKW